MPPFATLLKIVTYNYVSSSTNNIGILSKKCMTKINICILTWKHTADVPVHAPASAPALLYQSEVLQKNMGNIG